MLLTVTFLLHFSEGWLRGHQSYKSLEGKFVYEKTKKKIVQYNMYAIKIFSF